VTSDEKRRYEQSPRTAWMLYLRREALRMARAEVSVIVHVGLIYATFADWDGANVRPGVGTLATITGKSEDTVSRCLTALASAGLIERKRRQGGKTAVGHLLAPLTETIDWEPLLLPFSETRQAAYRRRQKSKAAAEEAAARASRNPSPDGFQNPSASGDLEPVPVGGTEEPRTRPRRGGTGTVLYLR
jgi:DNA-binding transcriptional ArsR family regulator